MPFQPIRLPKLGKLMISTGLAKKRQRGRMALAKKIKRARRKLGPAEARRLYRA